VLHIVAPRGSLAIMRVTCFALLALSGCVPRGTQPAPAPPSSVDTTNDAKCADPRPGPTHECVQECGPPVSKEGDPEPGWQWLSAEDAASREKFGCPICMPEDTRIDTPDGPRWITELAVGDPIWTLDGDGHRVAAEVVYVGSTPVVAGHTIVRITLADGRVVRASAGHPDARGAQLGTLWVGAGMSGSTIVEVERIPYDGARTHDVLPSGASGVYWADGVAVQSSFAKRR
jgi:hypothetical protein